MVLDGYSVKVRPGVLVFEDGHIEKGSFVEGCQIVACLQMEENTILLYEEDRVDVCLKNMEVCMDVWLEKNRAARLAYEIPFKFNWMHSVWS